MNIYMGYIEKLCKINYRSNQLNVGGFRGW